MYMLLYYTPLYLIISYTICLPLINIQYIKLHGHLYILLCIIRFYTILYVYYSTKSSNIFPYYMFIIQQYSIICFYTILYLYHSTLSNNLFLYHTICLLLCSILFYMFIIHHYPIIWFYITLYVYYSVLYYSLCLSFNTIQ